MKKRLTNLFCFLKKNERIEKNAGSEAIGTGEREREFFGNFLSSTAPIDLVGCFCSGGFDFLVSIIFLVDLIVVGGGN
jgi:hypothetical protein